jgi:hypothetical protein
MNGRFCKATSLLLAANYAVIATLGHALHDQHSCLSGMRAAAAAHEHACCKDDHASHEGHAHAPPATSSDSAALVSAGGPEHDPHACAACAVMSQVRAGYSVHAAPIHAAPGVHQTVVTSHLPFISRLRHSSTERGPPLGLAG